MTKAEKTRAFIISEAAPLFNSRGYADTSLSDIMAVTGLTKGAIYGNFSDKNEVALAVYEYHIQRMTRNIATAMSCGGNACEKLRAFTRFYREHWKRIFETGGCPVLNAAIEADDHLAFLKAPVQFSIRKWVKSLAVVIRQGQQEGSIAAGADAKTYATLFIMILEGGMMMAKIMNNHQLLFLALDRIDKILDEELSS